MRRARVFPEFFVLSYPLKEYTDKCNDSKVHASPIRGTDKNKRNLGVASKRH